MPRIAVIEGPDSGRTFELGRTNSVGSRPDCTVCLSDPEIQERHVKITVKDGVASFRDQSSMRSLSVNGAAKGQGRLRHGDILKIGGSLLLFAEDETVDLDPETGPGVAEPRAEAARRSAASGAAPLLAVLERKDGVAERVAAMARAGEALSALHEYPSVLEKVLDVLVDTFPADRASVVLADEETGQLRVAASRGFSREGLAKGPSISLGVLREILRTREALLVEDVRTDQRFQARRSMAEQKIRSVLAVPLLFGEQFLGAVVLDSVTRSRAFGEDYLNLLGVIASQMALAVRAARLAEQLKERAAMEKERELAAAIQDRVLPSSLPKLRDVEIAGSMQRATGLGGNFYDFVEKGEDLYVAFGDMSVQGMNASLVMVMARCFLRSIIQEEERLPDMVRELNRHMVRDTLPEVHMKFFLLKWDPGAGHFLFCEGGHDNLLLLHPGEKEPRVIRSAGPPLGIMRGGGEVFHEERLPFPPETVLLLFSDGMVEMERSDGARFGISRLRETLADLKGRPVREIAELILERGREFTGSTSQGLDATVLVAKRKS